VFIDSHTHLGNSRFQSDIPAVIQRARAVGVHKFVVPATDLPNARHILALSQQHAEIYPALGIHPCDADSVPTEPADTTWIDELRTLAQDPKVCGIGEIGLDFYHPAPEGFTQEAWAAQQHQVVQVQLDLAAELGFNAIIHTRNSHAEMLAVIRAYTGRLRAVFHCFGGTLDEAKELIDLGHVVSFTGNVTFKNAPVIQATARDIAEDGFMLETDSPFLAPNPYRGHRCEPAHLAEIARFIAYLRDCDEDHLGAITTATTERFFRLSSQR
jgi:TatD DNase family protein